MMKRVNSRDIWILFTFALWLIVEILFDTTIESVFGISKDVINSIMNIVITAMLLVRIVLLQTYKRKELIVIGMITLLLLVSAMNSHYLSFISTWLFIVAIKDMDYRQLVLLAKRILQILIPVVILLYFMGVIDDYTMYRGAELRQSLGFSHPNGLGRYIFHWVACSVYMTEEKNVSAMKFLFYSLLALFIYIVPNSQSALICLILLLVGVFLFQMMKNRKNRQKILAVACMMGAAAANLGSVVLSLLDLKSHPFWKQVDRLLSIRFSAGHRVYELYGMKWLGHIVYVTEAEREAVGITETLYLDNSYMTLLIRCGILVYLLFTVSFLLLLWKVYKAEEYNLLIILTVYSIYGIMEKCVYVLGMNAFILMMARLLYASFPFNTVKEKRITDDTGSNKKYGSRNLYWNCE